MWTIWVVAAIFLTSCIYMLVMLKRNGLLQEKKRYLFPAIDFSFFVLLVLLALFQKTGTWLEFVLMAGCFVYILCRARYIQKLLAPFGKDQKKQDMDKKED